MLYFRCQATLKDDMTCADRCWTMSEPVWLQWFHSFRDLLSELYHCQLSSIHLLRQPEYFPAHKITPKSCDQCLLVITNFVQGGISFLTDNVITVKSGKNVLCYTTKQRKLFISSPFRKMKDGNLFVLMYWCGCWSCSRAMREVNAFYRKRKGARDVNDLNEPNEHMVSALSLV